jgi:hypothetical protein
MQHTAPTLDQQAAQDIPQALLGRITAADALLLITITDDGKMEIAGVPKHPPFNPGLDASHALLQVIQDEYPNLVAKVAGEITDADRYRALRAFASLAHTNKDQFERVNAMFKDFEETLPPDAERTSADFDQIANFMVHALVETMPGMTAPTVRPDAPQIVLAGRV